MDGLFADFGAAMAERNGYKLAATLLPIAPRDQPGRLNFIWGSTNHHGVKGDVKHFINEHGYRAQLTRDEVSGWVEVYSAYWRALGEILPMQNGGNTVSPVFLFTIIVFAIEESIRRNQYHHFVQGLSNGSIVILDKGV
jgi:COP9 signalosome complex subunit 12